ncbi:MAG: radical SAM protein [Mariprofundaceae bacterium]
MFIKLNTRNHDRDSVGMRYIYPVVSRRSEGVSVGVNLNPNNACNWHCVYCQVPNLKRGSAPLIDLHLLESELRGFLQELLTGTFMQDCVPEGFQRISDIAISGNGEPTSSRQFRQVVEIIGRILDELTLHGDIKLVLITNGSYMTHNHVMDGIQHLAELGGEIWLKLDRARTEDIKRINGVALKLSQLNRNIQLASQSCPTFIQTCMHAWNKAPPDNKELSAYLDFLRALKDEGAPLKGVLLYGLARTSRQAEAVNISPVSKPWMLYLAERIQDVGYPVSLSM